MAFSEHRIGPVRLHDVPVAEIIRFVSAERGRLAFHLNAHALNLALKSPSFRNILGQADLLFCDGFGVKILSRLLYGVRLRHRNTPPDFLPALYETLRTGGKRIYFLGDRPEVVAAYAEKVNREQPGLVAGHHHGFFERGGKEEGAILAELAALRPDVILLGMGMPLQETWAVAHREALATSGITALTVGAAFAWGGERRRGPRWATDRGLEWLFRLCSEPGRVWRRYLVGLPEVTARLALFRLRGKGAP